jgi:predicted DCC family thiol-disulfide oxidoreductase YuxK
MGMIHAERSISSPDAGRTWNAGWVLYDARCGFCSWAAVRHARLLKRLGYGLKPLQEMEDYSAIPIDAQEMMILTPDKQLFSGVNAYLHILSGLPHTGILVRVLRWPPVYRFARRVYRWVADHRSRISEVCRLQPENGVGRG